jgi:hypothetical protein
MNKKVTQLFIVFFLAIFIASNFAFAIEDTSSNASTTASTSQLEITFPMSKDDFLLFYGITKDIDTNTKIDSIRKDFMDKFQALKDDYKKSINDAIGDNLLNSPVPLDTKDTTKVTAQVKKADPKSTSTIKKYSLKTDKASSTDIIISPVVNILDTSSGIHTENSTWFQKVKSIFNW